MFPSAASVKTKNACPARNSVQYMFIICIKSPKMNISKTVQHTVHKSKCGGIYMITLSKTPIYSPKIQFTNTVTMIKHHQNSSNFHGFVCSILLESIHQIS
jgi:hypothetical protein